MKVIVFAVVSALIIGFTVSQFASKNEYSPNEFKVIAEGLTDDGIKLIITVPPESLYYCPGATYKKSNGMINFSVVRAHIDTEPIVDVLAERRSDGSLALLFPLDHKELANGRSIEFKDSSGHSQGAWSISSKQQAEQDVPVNPLGAPESKN